MVTEINTKSRTTVFEDPFSEEVWYSTYRDYKDVTIDDSFMRVATAVASVEETDALRQYWKEQFYDLLQQFKGSSGGRILSNAGTEWGGTTLMNCFTSVKPKFDQDSLEGIVTTLRNQAQTLKSEGGWGANFSFIRPRGSFIKGIGVDTPGAVTYMEWFNKGSEIITSGSGLGKKNKKGKGKIRKGAMMGILDCVSGDTLIWTLEGKKPISELVGTNPLVYCTDGNGNVYVRKANKVWSKGVKKTVRIHIDNDTHLVCTPEHEVMLSNGTYKNAKDLAFGDSLAVLHKRLYNKYYQLGVTGSRKAIPEHIAVAEYKYGRYPVTLSNGSIIDPLSEEVHHIDFTTLNNAPENLEILRRTEHVEKHKESTKVFLEQQRNKLNENRRGKTWDEFYGVEKAQVARAKYKASREKNNKPVWNKGLNSDEYKAHYKDGFTNQFSNHKVVKVEDWCEMEVFDMSVPEFHNFVANDIFVHNCWHPDIEEFITAKLTPNRLDKFNLSANCVNEFMDKILILKEMVKAGVNKKAIEVLDKWNLEFPDTTHELYKELWDGDLAYWKSLGLPVIVHKTVSALGLWDLIMKSTYARNDPGVLFLDRANETHCWNYGGRRSIIKATNPCGEQAMPDESCCNLFSMNLTQFVNDTFTHFDLAKVKKYVAIAVRFLDNINSLSNAPLPEYLDSMRNRRRIGLGVMGWGSALYLIKTRFGSDKAEEIKDELMRVFTHTAAKTSVELAKEKGMFVGCDPELHSSHLFWKQIGLDEETIADMRKYGIRNSSLFSIQPTGNTSVLCNIVSGGLEPVFLPEYIRTVIVPDCPAHIRNVTPKYWEGEFFETSMFKFAKEGSDQILRGVDEHGTVYKIDKNRGLTKEVLCEDYAVRHLKARGEWDANADWAVTTSDLSVDEHIRDMQGFGKWIDASMSKTVNIPHDYPFEDFEDVYLEAYKTGYLKGITTYRAGTMMSVLSAKNENDGDEDQASIKPSEVIKRPKELKAKVFHPTVKGGKFYVAVGLLGDSPFEVFVGTNDNNQVPVKIDEAKIVKKAKGLYDLCTEDFCYSLNVHSDPNVDALTRMVSLSLNSGANLSRVVEQLERTHGDVFVFAKVLARTLKKFIPDGTEVSEECPMCGGTLIRQEGCKRCTSCDYSVCG